MDPLSSAYRPHVLKADTTDQTHELSRTTIESFTLSEKLQLIETRDRKLVSQMNRESGKFLISQALSDKSSSLPKNLSHELEESLIALYAQGVVECLSFLSRANKE